MSAEAWARACLALRLLAVDPCGLGGLHLRARAGPVRAAWLAGLDLLPLPRRRVHPDIDDAQLYGGLDLSATLAAGRLVAQAGLLAEPAALVLTMAERMPAGLAARLAQTLDEARGHCAVMLDEGAEADERAPAALRERCAFSVDLDGIGYHAADADFLDPDGLAEARTRLARVTCDRDAAAALVTLAARFGIDSLRAPRLAMAAARAHAALNGRDRVDGADVQMAAELVYPARATQAPAEEEPEAPPPEAEAPEPPPDPPAEEAEAQGETGLPPEEMLVDAVAALLPADMLAALAAGRARKGAGGSGAGAARTGNRRGRPLPSRPGRLTSDARVDIVATLRAAAPWQRLRRAADPDRAGLHVRAADIRLKRYEDRSDRLVIFAVDASGSSAMARLAEAKGAVELLLGQAYAQRDHVALIAFRGAGAEELLPPTRSLVQTKRRLAGLPGGGATPLAAGLEAAAACAHRAAAHGLTPTVALLTDGRANMARDGRADRAAAAEDATRMARALRAQGVPAIVLDTAARPQRALAALAGEMGARYLPLPRADAGRLSAALGAAMEG